MRKRIGRAWRSWLREAASYVLALAGICLALFGHGLVGADALVYAWLLMTFDRDYQYDRANRIVDGLVRISIKYGKGE